MFTRSQNLYDAIQIHTSLAANTEGEFFQDPKTSLQVTSGSASTFTKNEYHTNNKLNGQTERGQELLVKGFSFACDESDPKLLTDLLLTARPVFQLFLGDEKVFQMPLHLMTKLSNPVATSFSDAQETAKAQKMAIAMIDPTPFKLDYAIVIPELQSFKAKIIFKNALTIKKFNFDYGAAAADAAYTTAFHLFCSLYADETRK